MPSASRIEAGRQNTSSLAAREILVSSATFGDVDGGDRDSSGSYGVVASNVEPRAIAEDVPAR